MLDTRWQKVLIDLWSNRARTFVVALAVSVGVYAIGVMLDTRELLVREYSKDQNAALPASAILTTSPFDDRLADRIAELPGVAAAEGRSVVRTRVTDQAGALRELEITALPDFHSKVDALTPLTGKWPPAKREITLERMALDYLGVEIGQDIQVELNGDTIKTLTVVGTAHDAQQLSPGITDEATGYVTPETMDALGQGELYTEMRIRVAEHPHDRGHIQVVVDQVRDQLEDTGREVWSTRIITDSHVGPYIDTVVFIIASFGGIIFLLSGFMVVNAVTALIAHQVPQIGVMKLIGARRGQVMAMYLVTLLVYGAIAVSIAVPLAAITARLLMTELIEGLVNTQSDSHAISPAMLAAQVLLGLLLPLLAGLVPVLRGTRVTTQSALNDFGLTTAVVGQGGIERLLKRLQRFRRVQRPLLLAVRNMMRHKVRLAQTLVILIVGTALFIAVFSVRASVNATLADFMRFHGYDASIQMARPYRLAELEAALEQAPGVVSVEGWSLDHATRTRPDETESEPMRVYAVPAGSTLLTPQPSAGRWLLPTGERDVVINSDVLEDEPDLEVGNELLLEMDGREARWRVVGVVPTESRGSTLYMAHDAYARSTGTTGQVTHVQLVGAHHDAATQQALATAVRTLLEEQGFSVTSAETAQVVNSENRLMFTLIIAFLILMALLLAAVGGLGLTTTMSINVLERVREIGVLRAIGASNLSVRRIILAEGIAIGLLSWGLGALLSVPASVFMSEQIGLALLDVPLSYQYSAVSAAIWFVAILIVAVAASLGPARSAARLTVREVLAYE